jgi:hypothetical protein
MKAGKILVAVLGVAQVHWRFNRAVAVLARSTQQTK